MDNFRDPGFEETGLHSFGRLARFKTTLNPTPVRDHINRVKSLIQCCVDALGQDVDIGSAAKHVANVLNDYVTEELIKIEQEIAKL